MLLKNIQNVQILVYTENLNVNIKILMYLPNFNPIFLYHNHQSYQAYLKMKNQETESTKQIQNISTLTDPTNITLSNEPFQNQSPLKNKQDINCIKLNISKCVCMDKNCNNYAFVCQDENCQCQLDHEGCFITKTSMITKAISKKIISIKPLQDAINYTIDKIIDGLSQFRDKILPEIKRKFQFCGLNENQIKILTSIKLMNVQEITGSKISETYISFCSKEQLERMIQNNCQIIKGLQEKVHSNTKSIEENILRFQQQQRQYIQKNQSTIVRKNFLTKQISQSFFKHSKILKSEEKINSMLQLFKPIEPIPYFQLNSSFLPQKYAQITLLYRASENEFSTTKFHEICDGIKNTLTICQTTSGKIIGGFTTKEWGIYKPNLKEKYQASYCIDNSGNSFIFSLTHKDKFILKEDKKSILWWKQQLKVGPSFGGNYDLVIPDKANINYDSYINLNGSYLNQKYNLENGKKDNERFIGSSNNKFCLKQWQVWKIKYFQKKSL